MRERCTYETGGARCTRTATRGDRCKGHEVKIGALNLVDCRACGGSGNAADGIYLLRCRQCNGVGKVIAGKNRRSP